MKFPTVILGLLELAACIAGFLNWERIKNSYWRWFAVYLGFIALTEFVAGILYTLRYVKLPTELYRHFAIPLEFLFFYWLFYQYFSSVKIKNRWPLYAAVIYLLCWLIDILYIEDKMKLLFDSFSYMVGNILLLILILMFFIRFIKSNELLNYRESNMFWVCLGLLVFYLGSLPFYGLRTTIFREYRDFFYVYWYIQFGLNYLMYISFIISFIWGRPKQKYSLS